MRGFKHGSDSRVAVRSRFDRRTAVVMAIASRMSNVFHVRDPVHQIPHFIKKVSKSVSTTKFPSQGATISLSSGASRGRDLLSTSIPSRNFSIISSITSSKERDGLPHVRRRLPSRTVAQVLRGRSSAIIAPTSWLLSNTTSWDDRWT